MTGTRRYLAYGSNLLPARLTARVASARPVGVPVRLEGWSLRFHKRSNRDGTAKCDLVRCEGHVAWAMVYELHEDDIHYLDRAEGLGNGYFKMTMVLEDHGEVFLYLAQESHIAPHLKPLKWYKEYVLDGARAHDFPAPYIAAIAAVEAVEEPWSGPATRAAPRSHTERDGD